MRTLFTEAPDQRHNRLASRRLSEGVDQSLSIARAFEIETDDVRVVVGQEIFDELAGRDINGVPDGDHLREAQTAQVAGFDDVTRQAATLGNNSDAPRLHGNVE